MFCSPYIILAMLYFAILLFLFSVMAVGFACPSFGLDALSEVGFIESIVHCVFEHLSQTKQLRLKPIIRILLVK